MQGNRNTTPSYSNKNKNNNNHNPKNKIPGNKYNQNKQINNNSNSNRVVKGLRGVIVRIMLNFLMKIQKKSTIKERPIKELHNNINKIKKKNNKKIFKIQKYRYNNHKYSKIIMILIIPQYRKSSRLKTDLTVKNKIVVMEI